MADNLARPEPPPASEAELARGDPDLLTARSASRTALAPVTAHLLRQGTDTEGKQPPNTFLLNTHRWSTYCVLAPGPGDTKMSKSKHPAFEVAHHFGWGAETDFCLVNCT